MNLFGKVHALLRKDPLDIEMTGKMGASLELQTVEKVKCGIALDDARCAA